MVHRGTTRESRLKKGRVFSSTPSDKTRRHRNKLRIWRRAIKRLKAQELAPVPALISV